IERGAVDDEREDRRAERGAGENRGPAAARGGEEQSQREAAREPDRPRVGRRVRERRRNAGEREVREGDRERGDQLGHGLLPVRPNGIVPVNDRIFGLSETFHMFPDASSIASADPALWSAIQSEFRRQEEGIELIASENYASPAVLAAQGSVLTNKYAEGYPGKRYYGGCEFVDVAEQLAIDRVKKLFGAEYANVQPHSGSQANQAVYMAMLKPGDTILGMSLAHGGDLTHGASVNLPGKLFNAVHYRLDAKE